MNHLETIKHGDIITVSAELFDALLNAGLLAVTGHDGPSAGTFGKPWPTYGDTNDDGSVTCMLIDDGVSE
jgi:hypothetical protein